VETVPGWLDFAKIRYGGSHSDEAVDEAKKMGPVFLLLVLMVPFWLIFLQSNTGFQAQAVHLKVDLGNFMVSKRNFFCKRRNLIKLL
jgi:POT family